MENRIVDSTWLGRGRHVLLEQVLTCQTISKTRSRRPSLVPSNSRHLDSLSRLFVDPFFHSLARAFHLAIYLPTHIHTQDSNVRSFTRSLIHSRSRASFMTRAILGSPHSILKIRCYAYRRVISLIWNRSSKSEIVVQSYTFLDRYKR